MKKAILGLILGLSIAIPAHAQTYTPEQQALIVRIIELIKELQIQLAAQIKIETQTNTTKSADITIAKPAIAPTVSLGIQKCVDSANAGYNAGTGMTNTSIPTSFIPFITTGYYYKGVATFSGQSTDLTNLKTYTNSGTTFTSTSDSYKKGFYDVEVGNYPYKITLYDVSDNVLVEKSGTMKVDKCNRFTIE